MYSIRTPVDLAYVWNHCKLNNLDNFLLQNNSKQFTYVYLHSDIRLMRSGEESTLSSTSRREFSPSGKILRTNEEVDSSSLSTRAKKTRTKSIPILSSISWAKILITPNTSTVLGSSLQRTHRPTTVWKSGWTLTWIIMSTYLISRPYWLSYSRICSSILSQWSSWTTRASQLQANR